MSDQNAGLFSESQLSQIATFMVPPASKVKRESEKLEPPKVAQILEVQSPPPEDFNTQSDETKKGILRLADYIKRERKAKPTAVPQETQTGVQVKDLKLKEHILSPAPQEHLRRALETYAWVADYNSVVIGTCINKFL